MGLVYADIELIHSDNLALTRRGYLQEDRVRKMKVRVLVNTGSMLAINETVKIQLGLEKLDNNG